MKKGSLGVGIRFLRILSLDITLKIMNVLTIPIYLNLMSPGDLGLYNYTLTLVTMAAASLKIGQHIVIARFYHSSEIARYEIDTTVRAIFAAGIAAYILVILAFGAEFRSMLFRNELTPINQLCIFVAPPFLAMGQLISSSLVHRGRLGKFQLKTAMDFLSLHGISIVTLMTTKGPSAFSVRTAAMTSSYAILAVIWILLFLPDQKRFNYLNRDLLRRALWIGLPACIGSIANLFMAFGDKFVVEKSTSTDKLGVYTFAGTVIALVMLAYNSFQNAWLPSFFKERNLRTSIRNSSKMCLYILIILVVLGSAVSVGVWVAVRHGLIHNIYLGIFDYLAYLFISAYFQICGSIVAGYFQILEKTYLGILPEVIFACAAIPLTKWYVDKFGITGAAMSNMTIFIGLFLVQLLLLFAILKKSTYHEYR